MNYFLIGLWHATKSGFYMTIGHDQLSGWTDKKLQSTFQSRTLNLHQENVIVTVWWSAAHRLHCGFLNLGETITSEKYTQQIDEMRQKLQSLQPALVNRNSPIHSHNNPTALGTTNASKAQRPGSQSFAIHHTHLTSHQPTTISSGTLTAFCKENASTTSRMQKMLSKSSMNPEAWIFYFIPVA